MKETLIITQSCESRFPNPGVLRKAVSDTNKYWDDDKQRVDKQRWNQKCDFIPSFTEPMHKSVLPNDNANKGYWPGALTLRISGVLRPRPLSLTLSFRLPDPTFLAPLQGYMSSA